MSLIHKTLSLGIEKDADLASGSGLSGVTVVAIKNSGSSRIWLGEVGKGYPIEPHEVLAGPFEIGSTDKLPVVREHDPERDDDMQDQPIHVVLTHTA